MYNRTDIDNLTNKQLIAVCQRAKKELWKGKGSYWDSDKSRYVCAAIAEATRVLHGTCRRPEKLQKLVKAHIGRYMYLHDFIRAKLGSKLFATATPEQVQAWRFLMLDNMIKMLKEQA